MKSPAKNSVRYIGTYTFRFKSEAVKRYFSGRSLAYTDQESEPLLILPFYQENGQYDLWSYNNLWREAWDRKSTRSNLVPIVVPVGDIQDVSEIGDQDAQQYDAKKLQSMLNRYGAKDAVIAIAVPDAGFAQNPAGSATARGTLSVNLFRSRQKSAKHADQKLERPNGDRRTHDE